MKWETQTKGVDSDGYRDQEGRQRESTNKPLRTLVCTKICISNLYHWTLIDGDGDGSQLSPTTQSLAPIFTHLKEPSDVKLSFNLEEGRDQ